jgi:phospholipid/cholesterol/gamma-HCH transport system permease protein
LKASHDPDGPAGWAARPGIVERLGDGSLYFVEQTGRLGLFLLHAALRALTPPYRLRPIVRQVHFIGARSCLVVVVSGTFVGMVVALQFYDTLVRFGSASLLGSAVGLSLVRELGPVLTALMVVGRAGSAICAEVAIMRSEHQIDALECMSIDPYRYLIAPKLVAGVVSVPLLTAIFDVVGIIGGFVVGVVLFGVGSGAYFQSMAAAVLWNDIAMGFVKSLVFGLVIVWLAAGKGFFLHLDRGPAFGAEGVSRVTTNAVVLSSIAVLFSDYLISSAMR